MTEQNQNNKKKWWAIVKILLFFVVVGGIIFVIYLLLNSKETHISQDENSTAVASLICKAGTTEGMFFDASGVETAEQTVKMTFNGNRVNALTYTLEATYANEEMASRARSRMNADYDIYTEKRSESFRGISKQFSVIDKKAKVDLYTDTKKLNGVNVLMFGLSSDDLTSLLSDNMKTIKSIYEAKSYLCELNNY